MMKILFVVFLAVPVAVNAWMDQWAPSFECAPAKVRELPKHSVAGYVEEVHEGGEFVAEYSSGGALDLNGDGIEDFIFIIPWMGNGLSASGDDVHFLVSNGKNGRMATIMPGYGCDLKDVVMVGGRPCFRHSAFFGPFEKSNHNHWVFQLFSFEKDGTMKCANSRAEKLFPAATIFYENAKFRRVSLTPADLKAIAKETTPTSKKYP